ncbi:MAG TPA: hypothetical protein DCE42_27870, partial [Myxococcales bacterium]|nr:hypothetical protein [Myxococcales bacterium]
MSRPYTAGTFPLKWYTFSFLGTTCLLALLFACNTPLHTHKESLRRHTQLLFSYPKDGTFTTKNFYDFPYPHVLRLDKDGSAALANMPAPERTEDCEIPASSNSLVTSLLKSIDPDEYITDLVKFADQDAKGASVNPTIYMRFTRPLSEKSLPPPAATLTQSSPIFLIDIDPQSPRQGQRYPLVFKANLESRFLPGPTLAIRPSDGFPLRPNTTYALVVLTELRDNEDWPLQAHPELTKLASQDKLSDPTQESLRAVYAPMFSYLKTKQDIEPNRVAAATVFKTDTPTQELKTLYTFIKKEMPAPTPATDIECKSNASSTPYITCTGRFDSPLFQNGSAPFLTKGEGIFTYDANGKPKYTMKQLPFAFTIPKRYLDAGALKQRNLPVVMYAHGTGGSYRTFINNGTARALAERGIAAFGIDQAVHGERGSKLGGVSLDFLFFNALNLAAARDNVRQSAIDYYWQVRFLKIFSVSYAEQTFKMDPKRIWFMGHSQGGLTGPPFLAFEEDVRAAFLSAPGGYLIGTLLYKTKPKTPIQIKSVVDYLLCDKKAAASPFHPVLGVAQHAYDPGDPLNYAPPILKPQHAPLNLLMTEGLTDEYAPPAVFEALAIAMGLPHLGPIYKPLNGLGFQSIPHFSLPVRGNFLHTSGVRTTVGFTQHKECKYT